MSEQKSHPNNYLCRHCGARSIIDSNDVYGPNRDHIFQTITRERDFQEQGWGDNPHAVGEWLLIMQAELDEAKQAWVEGHGDNGALKEILQVISVGVACLEQHGVVER